MLAGFAQRWCSTAIARASTLAFSDEELLELGKRMAAVQRRLTREKLPKKIFLVRHGQSMANDDEGFYVRLPDNKHELSPLGRKQAVKAGEQIRELVGADESFTVYHSPFKRTRQTCQLITEVIGRNRCVVREDPRLREQEWGNFQTPEATANSRRERDIVGSFYYRFPTGESGGDVYDRVAGFSSQLWRDMTGSNSKDNVVLVSHGLTLRLFMMRFYRWSVDTFHKLWNFNNAQVVVMEKDAEGKFHILREPDCSNIFADFLLNEGRAEVPHPSESTGPLGPAVAAKANTLPVDQRSLNNLFSKGEWS